MENNKVTWLMTVKLPSGQPLFSLLMESELVGEAPIPPTDSAPTAPTQGQPRPGSNSGDGEPKMTEPQKRYLFRLLGAQGIEGKTAEDHLKGHFKVASLREASKAAASEYINKLVASQKEAHGS